MRSVQIVNRTRDSILGSRVGLAESWWQRVRGFLRHPEPKRGEGLLLSPCRAVHMMGMRYSLDVIFLDRHGQVVAQYPQLKPGRSTAWHARAKYALELPQGTILASGTQHGDYIVWLVNDVKNDGANAELVPPSNGTHHDSRPQRAHNI